MRHPPFETCSLCRGAGLRRSNNYGANPANTSCFAGICLHACGPGFRIHALGSGPFKIIESFNENRFVWALARVASQVALTAATTGGDNYQGFLLADCWLGRQPARSRTDSGRMGEENLRPVPIQTGRDGLPSAIKCTGGLLTRARAPDPLIPSHWI